MEKHPLPPQSTTTTTFRPEDDQEGPWAPSKPACQNIIHPVHRGVCSRCAKICTLISRALDDLPPGFDVIFSRTPASVKIADLGESYRPWWEKSDLGTALRARFYEQTIGLLLPTCNLCVMISASRVWSFEEEEGPDVDELRLFRLNDQLVYRYSAYLSRGGKVGLDAFRRDSPIYLTLMRKETQSRGFDDTLLGAVGRTMGFLVVRRRGQVPRAPYLPSLVQPRFETAVAQKWLSYCKQHHQGPCVSKRSMVKGLCLIDCRSGAIVTAPVDAEYVALSYCWGQPTPGEEASRWLWWWSWTSQSQAGRRAGSHSSAHASDGVLGTMPLSLPAVISDAMKVTMGLGFSYLWVDRYCIDQRSLEKHNQISQMDSIYQGAELTIIAAAGEDPSYGLPGVGLRARRQQPACSAADLEILSTMQHPHDTIRASAWYKRAWTFQEGILSRRRLVFTDEQVYYECDVMNCYESIQSDLDTLHTEDKLMFRDYLLSGIFARGTSAIGGFDLSSQKPSDQEKLLHTLVENYTERSLTYDTDSLNAFAGILRRFEASRAFISNIWGITIRCTLDSTEGDVPELMESSFVAALAWKHEVVHSGEILPPPRRRHGFPSWSWCGWAGRVAFSNLPSRNLLHSVTVEDSEAVPLTLSEYLDKVNPRHTSGHSSPALWIRGHVLPLAGITATFGTPTSPSNESTRKSLRIFGFESYPSFSMDFKKQDEKYETLGEGGSRRCVCLGDDGSSSLTFLILEPLDGGDWQRAGVIWLYLDPNIHREGEEYLSLQNDYDTMNKKVEAQCQVISTKFWKRWVEHELRRSVPLDQVEKLVSKLPTQSFRIV